MTPKLWKSACKPYFMGLPGYWAIMGVWPGAEADGAAVGVGEMSVLFGINRSVRLKGHRWGLCGQKVDYPEPD